MSDKNIDKDIERINNIIHCHDGTRVHYIDISYSPSAYDDSDDCEKFVIAIENVLSELETYKKVTYKLVSFIGGLTEQNIETLIEKTRNEVLKDE